MAWPCCFPLCRTVCNPHEHLPSSLFGETQVDEMFQHGAVDAEGNFDYQEYTRVLKHGSKDEEAS